MTSAVGMLARAAAKVSQRLRTVEDCADRANAGASEAEVRARALVEQLRTSPVSSMFE